MRLPDNKLLIGARYKSSQVPIQTYDDGDGKLYISRNPLGINGIVRAKCWGDAYQICEDELFPEATETVDELVKEYGFKRESKKVVQDPAVKTAGEYTQVGERFAIYPDDYPNGKLAPHFVRWVTVETPDPAAWTENDLFCDAYGFRNNGPNERDTLKHGIYQKDLNGDYLDVLTDAMLGEMGIELVTEDWQGVS